MCKMLTIARIARKFKLPWDCEFNRELEHLAQEAEKVVEEERIEIRKPVKPR